MSEPIKPKKDKRLSASGKPLIYTESLREIFDFEPSALRSNEDGVVTNGQKQKIQDELKAEADAMWLMVTIFLATAVLLAIIFTFQGYPTIPLVVGVGGLTAGVLGVGYFRQSRLVKDTDRLRAIAVEGVPQVRLTMSGSKQAILDIGGQKLPITYQEAAALNEFDLPPMRVYYAPNSQQVLSAEVLQAPDVEKLKNDDLVDDDEYIYSARQLDEQESVMRR